MTCRPIVLTKGRMNGREALLQAFDRLFDAAAKKLGIRCTDEERAEARRQFAERFEQGLEIVSRLETGIPDDVIGEMEAAIAELSPADVAGVIASVPLAQQAQQMVRALAMRHAERRLLEQLAMQADTRYGGN